MKYPKLFGSLALGMAMLVGNAPAQTGTGGTVNTTTGTVTGTTGNAFGTGTTTTGNALNMGTTTTGNALNTGTTTTGNAFRTVNTTTTGTAANTGTTINSLSGLNGGTPGNVILVQQPSTSVTGTGTNAFQPAVPFTGSGVDRQFLRRSAAASLAEINFGFLAQTNSTNTVIQQYGAKLVQDHTTAYAEAAALANNLGFQVLTNARPADRRRFSVLAGLPQDRFDRVFIRTMITDHNRSIRQAQRAAMFASTADVRTFAREQMVVLTDHLVTALEAREQFLRRPAQTNTNVVNNTSNNNNNNNNNDNSNNMN